MRSGELQQGFKPDFDYAEDADEVDIEYCVYDVTPDVSIDFVSFTTEESEGKKCSWKPFSFLPLWFEKIWSFCSHLKWSLILRSIIC